MALLHALSSKGSEADLKSLIEPGIKDVLSALELFEDRPFVHHSAKALLANLSLVCTPDFDQLIEEVFISAEFILFFN